MKMIEHVAIENGTMSDPYRFVTKGDRVLLTEEQAAFYKGSWLRPTKEGQTILNTPLFFPGINNTGMNGIQAMREFKTPVTRVSEQYEEQMKAVIANEKAIDGSQTKGEGTGNLDPLA